MKRILYLLFLFLSGVLILLTCLAVVEAAFRFNEYLNPEKNWNYYSPSLCCGYKLRKNFSRLSIQIDHRGFRKTPYDHSNISEEKVYKIVILGGAPTMGSVNNEYLAYPSYLELILNSPLMEINLPEEKKYIDVINAAIPSYISHFLNSFVENYILQLKPDMVIISIGTIDSMPYENSSSIRSLYKHIPLLYWYLVKSSSFPFIKKFLPLNILKTKESDHVENSETRDDFESDLLKKEYEYNIRKSVKTLKDKKITAVIMPWAEVANVQKVSEFSFIDEEIVNDTRTARYQAFTQVMERVSKEFNIPLIKTPLQISLVPRKHSSKYFTTSGWHINNYGSRIVGFSLAQAVAGILKGKTNKEIYNDSFASIPEADLLDLHSYIVMKFEQSGKVMKQKIIVDIEKNIAENCMANLREDLSIIILPKNWTKD
jgi:lysophospholipase L1-like esterase